MFKKYTTWEILWRQGYGNDPIETTTYENVRIKYDYSRIEVFDRNGILAVFESPIAAFRKKA